MYKNSSAAWQVEEWNKITFHWNKTKVNMLPGRKFQTGIHNWIIQNTKIKLGCIQYKD